MNFIVSLSLFFTLLALPHPVHISVTTVEFKGKEKKIDIMFKLFVDDFETIVSKKYQVELNVGKPNENPQCVQYFSRYINEQFNIMVNDNQIPAENFIFISKKINEGAIWLTYELPKIPKLKKIYIYNSLMNDMFDDQTNLLILKVGDTENGYSLTKKKRDIEVEF